MNFGTYSAGSARTMTINELNKQYGLDHRADSLSRRGADVDRACGRHARCRDGQLHGRADPSCKAIAASCSAVHTKKVAAIPEIADACPSRARRQSSSPSSGFSGWALPKATPQPIVDRLSELCVAANNDPKVKEVLATFVLEPAIGFKTATRLYQRELPVWMEAAQSLGLPPA